MSILLLGAGLGATQTRLLDYAPGASAAYSLRQVGRQYNGPVVRVRRESDSTERDFTASQIDNGTLTTWVNATPDLPLDQSSGAAAAYSLRSLSSSYSGNVIRARRASDNDERDFTANEIIDGTLTTWTNTSMALPLDEASGAAAAYSLRNLSASYSGDVVRVIRSGDNLESDFSASEITDGTLESWVIAGGGTEHGYVKTWYDQSGNDNHATQTTAAYQPRIVISGTLITENSKPAIYFYSNLLTTSGLILSTVSLFLVANSERNPGQPSTWIGQSDSPGQYLQIDGPNNRWSFAYANPVTRVYIQDVAQMALGAMIGSSSGTATFVNGVPGETGGAVDFKMNKIGSYAQYLGGPYAAQGKIQELIIYPSDLTSQRTAIEANLAEFYGIDLPAGVDTANNEVDAFVTTWYDQSGNSNHAVQSTATYQPKIVSAGALITKNGKPALQFDGVNDRYKVSFSLGPYLSMFSVVSANETNDFIFDSYDTPNNNSIYVVLSTHLRFIMPKTSGVGYPNRTYTTGSQAVLSMINFSDASQNAWVNGSDSGYIVGGGVLTPTPMNGISIGCAGTDVGFFNGTYQELIIYDSDQSDFRQGIETNTALHYNIFTTMKYKVQSNEVDGYVATWYDQSGNGYNAAQSTADYQPKLVSAGALITDGDEPAIEFDGTSDKLTISDSTVLDLPATVFIVLTHSSSTAGDRYIFARQSSGSNGGVLIRQLNITGTIELQLIDAASPFTSITATNRGGQDVVTAIASPPNTSIYSNFLLEGTDASASGFANAAFPVAIGARPDSATNYWDSKIQEIIVYPFDQSSQRQRIEGNLAWKYNIEDKLPWDHPYARSFPGFGSQRVPTDSDTIAYLTAVSAADGVGVEVPIANAIEDFIVGCKADGIWDSIKASCILAGARSLEGALVPLVGPAPTNLPVANGFVSSDYSRTAGLKGDGTSYLDSGRADTDDGQNDHHIAFHSTAGDPSTGEYPIGVRNSASPNTYTIVGYDFWSRSTVSGGSPAVISTGTYGLSRNNGTSFNYMRASGTEASASVASTSATSGTNHFVFGINLAGTASFKTSATLAFYSIGTSINLAQLDTRISNLIASINLYLDIGLNPDNYDQDTINYIYNAYKAGGSLA